MASTKEELQDKRDLTDLTTTIYNKYKKLKEAESKFQSAQTRFFQPILKTKTENSNKGGSDEDRPFALSMSKAAIDEILKHGKSLIPYHTYIIHAPIIPHTMTINSSALTQYAYIYSIHILAWCVPA